ncbi:hypothetical protein AAFN90_00890 [Erwiniaceae bacterium CAU 1747]
MKTQMQIVQEAIARLESMSKEEFRATLIEAGAVEVQNFYRKSVSGFNAAEPVQQVADSDYTVVSKGHGLHREMSIVF